MSATTHSESTTSPPVPARALDALNFFLADVRDGLGPYLAIYLVAVRGPSHGWNEATVGMVLTVAGIVGLIAQTPAGVLVDRARNKPRVVMVAAVLVTLSSVSLPFVTGAAAVVASQSIAAAAASVFAPAISAVTLGLVGSERFARRVGRNEAFNHAGNATSAAIAGALAWRFGPAVVFWLMSALAGASILAAACIRNRDIDNAVARGLDQGSDENESEGGEQPSAWRCLIENRPLLTFAAVVFAFHLANAAMLTSVGQLLARTVGQDRATSLTAACIVAAQLVMVPVAVVVGRKAGRWGTKPIFLAAFAVLAARGLLYTWSDDPRWLVGVQALDGIGAGIAGALFPVVIADLTRGSGRFNASQGAVATVQGLGAALSATLAGAIVVAAGYDAAFLTLATIAAGGFLLYLVAMPETKH